jgi:multidrug efflux pump subunit AcrB
MRILPSWLVLGAQFKSDVQPLIIFAALPLAFTGVVFGLYLTDNPLSLYTMYGMVALTGVIISTAIVLIDAANTRVAAGSDPLKATIFASTRRLLPIILTATTTFVDLVHLAAGWGGKSLIWSPMATAIVYGLLVSTVLTLFVVPLLYFLIELAKPHRATVTAQRLPDKVKI